MEKQKKIFLKLNQTGNQIIFTKHFVQTFCEAIRNDINNATGESTQYRNLKEEKIQAMNDLRKREDLIFTTADKGAPLSSWM